MSSAGYSPETASIARDFGAASVTYESASRLQRLMGQIMLDRLSALLSGREPVAILDLGCGTGHFTRRLAECFPGARITGADLSPGMISQARKIDDGTVTWVVADAERLPFAAASFDLVFSNLMIQWCRDPGRVLGECRRVLAAGGLLQCSTLLDGSLRELAAAWAAADPEYSHVNRFEPLASMAGRVGEVLPGAKLETDTVMLEYDSPLALARELKHLGAGYKGGDRRRTMTAPGRIRSMSEQYPRRMGGGIAASYEACWISYDR